MGIPILFLRLEAPMMAFGSSVSWDYKDTLSFPTKSAIVGLLSAALGYPKNDRRIIEFSNKINISVRTDRRGSKFNDFQIITGTFQNAKGKILNEKIKTSTRTYVADASFLVAITGDETVLLECKKALDNPKWIPFIGRKCCIQSIPLTGRLSYEYDSIDEAFNKEPLRKKRQKSLRFC